MGLAVAHGVLAKPFDIDEASREAGAGLATIKVAATAAGSET